MNAISPARIWFAIEAVDMRIGIDGLSTRVQQALGKSPCDGSAYVFCNRRGTVLKMLVWDGTGVWLCQRRLHKGSFVWPKHDAPTCELSQAQFEWLITGVDWQRLSPQKQHNWEF